MRAALTAGAVLAPALAFSVAAPVAAAEEPWIDTSDRAEVLEAYLAEFEREEPASGYTGDVDTCTPGTTTQAYRDSIVQRVNWYRRMAGLDTVTERASYSSATQETSMMMSAEGSLSHTPGSGWACHTATGASTAGVSNLALGVNGLGAIDAYVRDPGSNNHAVGHRRTILYPQLLEVGSGDVESQDGHWAANTLHVFDDNLWGPRPDVREARDFVAWPPSGYVPAETTWGRWSFSLYGGDFSAATVTVTDSIGAIQVNVLERIQPANPASRIAPEPSIVWAVGGDTNSTQLPEPTDGDECYTITIGDVKVGGVTQADYIYETCILDLDYDPSSAPNDPPSDPPSDGGDCDGIAFANWTVPCWQHDGKHARRLHRRHRGLAARTGRLARRQRHHHRRDPDQLRSRRPAHPGPGRHPDLAPGRLTRAAGRSAPLRRRPGRGLLRGRGAVDGSARHHHRHLRQPLLAERAGHPGRVRPRSSGASSTSRPSTRRCRSAISRRTG